MNRSTNNRVVGLTVGMILLMVSQLTPWLQYDWKEGDGANVFARLAMPNGANGVDIYLSKAGLGAPIWLVVGLGLLSLVLMLLNLRGATSLVPIVCLIPWLFSLAGLLIGVFAGFTTRATDLFGLTAVPHLRIGLYLAFAGLIVGFVSGVVGSQPKGGDSQ